MVDFAQGLMQKAHNDPTASFRLTGEYICLVNYVVNLPPPLFGTHRQYAIVETPGHDSRSEVTVLFVSDLHPIENRVDSID